MVSCSQWYPLEHAELFGPRVVPILLLVIGCNNKILELLSFFGALDCAWSNALKTFKDTHTNKKIKMLLQKGTLKYYLPLVHSYHLFLVILIVKALIYIHIFRKKKKKCRRILTKQMFWKGGRWRGEEVERRGLRE